MRLRRLFLTYVLSTAVAIAMPFMLAGIEHVRRWMKPVNSEKAIETPPRLTVSGDFSYASRALPACVAPDGTEYYGDRDVLYAKTKSGIQRNLDSEVGVSDFRSCAVRADGAVYVLARRDSEGWLRVYSALGQLDRTVQLPEVFSRLAISRNGTAYLAARPRHGATVLTAFDSTGATRWQVEIGGPGGASWDPVSPAVGPDGTIYAVSDNRAAPELIAVAPDGRKLWSVQLSGPVSDFIVGRDGRIFVNVPMGNVIAFDLRGQKLWQFYSGNQNNDGGLALAPDGTLYFASLFVYALDGQGKTKWNFKSELTYTRHDYFDKQPVVAEDGTIYAVSLYQQLYAITPDGRKKWHLSGEPTNVSKCWDQVTLTPDAMLIARAGRMHVTSGLAKEGWPTRNQDDGNRRSQEGP
jgi:outer membrane protein assembly factor BamB